MEQTGSAGYQFFLVLKLIDFAWLDDWVLKMAISELALWLLRFLEDISLKFYLLSTPGFLK